jgi:1,5-anhydro-D-fructose reductase (1,5-anhydro-D-mannitol-forming)
MTLGWAMVGTGAHVKDRMAPSAQRADETRLVAVYSRDKSRANDYAKDFGFARAYDDYSSLLADDDVDVVYLATPNHLHEQQTIQAAEAGKHVLVEKPMALTNASAQRMVDACRSRGVKLGVGFHLRHHPAHIETKRLLQSGALGKPVVFRMEWLRLNAKRSGWWQDPEQVGAYISMARGVHLLDLICFLTDQMPIEVTSMTDGQREDRPLEETALAILRMPDDVFCTILASRLFPNTANSLAIYGSEGRALALDTVGTDQGGTLQISTSNVDTRVAYQGCDPYRAEIEAFNRAIVEDLEPNASGVDGANVVRITEAMLESARTKRAVAVAPAQTLHA